VEAGVRRRCRSIVVAFVPSAYRTPEKVRENRLRRMAERQGHQLVKSRRRDPRAYDYGRYWITDPATKVIVAGHDRFGMNLDEAEVWLTGEEI
jgi:hypothetical protein